MIPILYPKGATKTDTTTTNGLGALVDCIKCEVTEERNGIYELSMQYPITGARFAEITEGALIKAKPNDKSAPQLFRIYKSSAPLKGIVTYSAEHISYDLNGLPVAKLVAENTSAEVAMRRAFVLCPISHSFTAYSDITTPNSTTISKPTTIRAALGGTAGGVLDTYGGEFEFDNYDVHLWKNRGANNGVMLRYGKNITDIKQERNIASCYTHIFPYAVKTITETAEDGTTTETETILTLSEGVLPLINPADVGHTRALNVNFSDDFSESDTFDETTLRTKAEAHAQAAELYAPDVNITLSFVNLAQTEDYKEIAPLETVGLCDTVNVYFEKLNISAHAKVIKTVYDTLKEKYSKIEVGSVKANFANTVKSLAQSIESTAAQAQAGDALLTAKLIVESERITAEVSRASAAEGVLSSQISTTAEAITAEVQRAESAESTLRASITANADRITAEVTNRAAADLTLSSRISAQADKIALVVEETNGKNVVKSAAIIAAINGDTSSVTIDADKVNIKGAVTAEYIEALGITVPAANITGKLTADQIDVSGITAKELAATYTVSNGTKTNYFNGSGISQRYKIGTTQTYESVIDSTQILFRSIVAGSTTTAYGDASGFKAQSDKNVKSDISELSGKYSAFFDLLSPVCFKYKGIRNSGFYTGFIAQEVEAALGAAGLNPQDFSALVKRDGTYWLDYNGFVALCVYEIQQLKAEINELKTAKNAE